METNTVWFGEKASFGDLEARWAARLNPALLAKGTPESEPYTVFTSKRTQKMVYAKGKPIHELVDADGTYKLPPVRQEVL
jgi:hypothetical protein